MAVHVGGRGPGHMSRKTFNPTPSPMPAGAMTIVRMADANNTLKYIPNAARPALTPKNLIRFVKGSTIATAGMLGTFTFNYGTGPEGQQTSIRVITNTATPSSTNAGTWPAGTYTVSAEYYSAAGTTFRTGANGTGNLSATTIPAGVWTTVSKTITHAGGALTLYWVDPNGVAQDVQIDNCRVHTGSVDLGVDAPNGDLLIGNTAPASANPDLSTGQFRADGVFPIPGGFQSLTSVAAFVMMNVPTAPASTKYVIQTGNGVFALGADAAGARSLQTGSSNQTAYAQIAGRGWTSLAVAAKPGHAMLMMGGIPLRAHTSFAGTTSALFSAKATGFPADTLQAGEAIYLRDMTAAEMVQACHGLESYARDSGKTVAQIKYGLFTCGDSITAHTSPTSYATQYFTANPTVVGSNLAFSGDTLTTQNGRITLFLPYWTAMVANGQTPVVSLLIGRNDSTEMIADPAAYYVRLKAAWASIKATGAKLVVVTILPSTLAGYNTARNAVNVLIRSDPSLYDALVDFGDIATTMGADAAAADTTYYSDGTHPTQAGHDLLAPVYAAVMDPILAALA